MTVPQNLITSLAFFTDKSFQTFRQSYCSGVPFVDLEARLDRLVPFIIKRPNTSTAAVDYVYLVRKDGTRALDITSGLAGLGAAVFGSNAFIYWQAAVDIPDNEFDEFSWSGSAWGNVGEKAYSSFVDCSGFYLEVKDGATTYYSESFQIGAFPEFAETPDSDELTRLRIAGVLSCYAGQLPPDQVEQKLYINARCSDPNWTVSKDVSKFPADEEKSLWAKVRKSYKVVFYATETVCDWLATLCLYESNGVLTFCDQYGVDSTIYDVEFRYTWDDAGNGCVCRVELSFVRDFSETICC
jgi:hypothetical protein